MPKSVNLSVGPGMAMTLPSASVSANPSAAWKAKAPSSTLPLARFDVWATRPHGAMPEMRAPKSAFTSLRNVGDSVRYPPTSVYKPLLNCAYVVRPTTCPARPPIRIGAAGALGARSGAMYGYDHAGAVLKVSLTVGLLLSDRPHITGLPPNVSVRA